MKNSFQIRCRLAGVVFFLIVAITPTVSQGISELTPSLAVREEYNDNIFFDDDGEVDDYITTLAPKIEYVQKSERHTFLVSGGLEGLVYADNEDLNHADQRYVGELQYRVSPRFGFGMDAGYIEDSRANRDIDQTGLILGTDLRRRQQYGTSANFLMTEKAAFDFFYRYQKDDFEEDNANDFDTHSAAIGFTYNLGAVYPGTIGRSNFGYTQSRYSTATVETVSMTVGFSRQYTELYRISMNAGARNTRTAFDFGVDDSDTWGAVGQLAFTYNGELSNGGLTFSHDVNSASGQIGSTERTGVRLNVDRRFTEDLSGYLGASFYLNRSDKNQYATSEIDQQTVTVRPRLHYDIAREIALELAYTYSVVFDKEADTERMQHIVFLQLLLEYPLLES